MPQQIDRETYVTKHISLRRHTDQSSEMLAASDPNAVAEKYVQNSSAAHTNLSGRSAKHVCLYCVGQRQKQPNSTKEPKWVVSL